jgi:hypothetical protein
LKKSLNFGIFKHLGGNGVVPTTNLPPISTSDMIPKDDAVAKARPKTSANKNESSTVVQKLEAIGLKCVAWPGKCDGDKVSMGKYDVPEGDGGMYGLVFDNTFSKQVSKTTNFVLMTYSTNSPPKSGHHLHFSQASSTISLSASPALTAVPTQDSIPFDATTALKAIASDPRPKSGHATENKSFGGTTFYTGILLKKRRTHRNFARRFFSLDFTSCTLSYYRNRHSSALRGSIPLSLAAVGTNGKTREISIDSGAEVWHLKASNPREFTGWKDALERASSVAANPAEASSAAVFEGPAAEPREQDPVQSAHWNRVEALLSQVSGIRDAVRRLAQDTDPKYMPSSSNLGFASNGTLTPTASETTSIESFKDALDERLNNRPSKLWKRKASSANVSPAGLFRRGISAQFPFPYPSNIPTSPHNDITTIHGRHNHGHHSVEDGVHDHCMAILRDLDQVVAEFSTLLTESKHHRLSLWTTAKSRRGSTSSVSSDEFFDANDGDTTHSQLLTLHGSDDAEDHVSISSGSSTTDYEFEPSRRVHRKPREGQDSLFPAKPKSLIPLPLERVRRRRDVPPPKVPPPSLISFLRKNVGKDLSTIAMPVSSNEPMSLLQRVAEQLEYSDLLDAAASPDVNPTNRLLYIAAFAVSNFSCSRVKERAIRKPFNPMLGETFELVREDKGFRLIAEKVSHHPVRLACQAESKEWTFLQAPMPVQKFWGKSAELNMDGRVRIFLHSTTNGREPELYSWTQATSFLRNVVVGEKYVEPVSTMTIVSEATGAKAVVTFKAGGMFAGRSEEVSVQLFDAQGEALALGLAGKWTSHLNITSNGADTGKMLWRVGALVDNAPQRYGFPAFAASLNEITEIEDGFLPPTDSRLRPDQRAYEDGEVDRAEALKATLEERQRARRRVMEEHGQPWVPKWFIKVGTEGDEEIWRLKSGRESYWDARMRGDWGGVLNIF